MNIPQVKICGITTSDQAVQCARLGAAAIGIVLYEKSPRNVSVKQAAKIAQSINGLATAVAVTVDMDIDNLLATAMITGISTFQLHGNESNDYIIRLKSAGLRVIKHIDEQGDQLAAIAASYNCSTFLVECGKGALPGGNGSKWDWSQAKVLAGIWQFVLAGGLNCQNVAQAAQEASCDAVDVSSSLELQPGIKDMKLVEEFIQQVRQVCLDRNIRKIF